MKLDVTPLHSMLALSISGSPSNLIGISDDQIANTFSTGDSSVSFASLFLIYIWQINNIYKVEQDSLYFFFFKGDKKKSDSLFNGWGIFGRIYPFISCGSPRNSLQSDISVEAWNILLIRWYSFQMLCLACPCHLINDQFSDLDTSH